MRVLVVDDDPAGRYLVRSIVVSRGHEAIEAADGEEALVAAHERRPDIVITDILMPRMDGYQLCRAWKSDPELASVPIVFYTASYTDPADERFAQSLGADGFWRKPTDPDVLLASLEELAGVGEPVPTRQPVLTDETEILQEYSSRLVNKLEEKAASLEKANTELRRAMEILGEEVAVKANLIAELNADVLERKRVEGELRRERDFTTRVVEFADLFVAVLDRDLKVVMFSQGAERLTGYTADEVIGKDYFEVFVPDDEAEWRRARVAELGSGQTDALRYEATLRSKSGRRSLVQFSSTATVDAGAVTAYNIFGIDMTAQRRSENVDHVGNTVDRMVYSAGTRTEVVRAACDKIAERFGFPLVVSAIKREDGTIVADANVSGEQYLASDPVRWDEGASYPSALVIGERRSLLRRVGAADDAWSRHVGAFGFVDAFASPLLVNDDVVGAMVYYTRDPNLFDDEMQAALDRLTSRLAVSLAVLEARDQIRLQSAALESAADAIVITDADRRVQWVNPAFCSLTGYQSSEASSLQMRSLVNDEVEYQRLSGLMEAARRGRPERIETVGVRKDGSRYFESVSVTRVEGDEPDTERFVWLTQDITERMQLEQLKSSFVATVSHELRTPLTSIIGFTDLMAQMSTGQLSERGSELVRKVRGHSIHMKQLVEELLEVSMMQSEGLRLLKRPNDLEQVVRVYVDAVERTPDHRVSVDIPDDLPLCVCDAERLGRAVGNLVSNAVKYSPNGGPVDVKVRTLEGDAVISVADKGVGLAPEDLPRLFDRFTQGDMSSTRSYGGMGLGLFVADQIVKAHGGNIEVESSLGKGSTFTIRFPMGGE